MCRVLNGPVMGRMGRSVATETTALSPSRRNLCRPWTGGSHPSSPSLCETVRGLGRSMMTWKCEHATDSIGLHARHGARGSGGIKMARIGSLLPKHLQWVADKDRGANTWNRKQPGTQANAKVYRSKGLREKHSQWGSGQAW